MLKGLSSLVSSLTEFLKAIGPIEVGIFLLLFGAFWVWLDAVIYPQYDLMGPMSGWVAEHVRPILTQGVTDG